MWSDSDRSQLEDVYSMEAVKEFMAMCHEQQLAGDQTRIHVSYFSGLPWSVLESLFPELKSFIDERLEHNLNRTPRDKRLYEEAHQAAQARRQNIATNDSSDSLPAVCIYLISLPPSPSTTIILPLVSLSLSLLRSLYFTYQRQHLLHNIIDMIYFVILKYKFIL